MKISKSNTVAKRFNLTPAEWEAVKHRLEVPDAVCDALVPETATHRHGTEKPTPENRTSINWCLTCRDWFIPAGTNELTADAVADACNALERGDWDGACMVGLAQHYKGIPVAHAVMVEAIEGSTYYATTIANGNPQAEAAAWRAITGAARKIGNVLGFAIQVPRC
jgi:hypothetical protein